MNNRIHVCNCNQMQSKCPNTATTTIIRGAHVIIHTVKLVGLCYHNLSTPLSEQTRPPRVSAHRHQLPSLDADNKTKYEPWKKSSTTGLGRGEVSWKPPPRASNNALSGGGYHSSVASGHRKGGIHGRTDWTAK